MKEKKLRIAAFGGFRGIPPKAGAAGSDKFAVELYPRIVNRECNLLAYARIYPNDIPSELNREYEGVKIKYFKTVEKAGFDSLVHSCKATFDIIINNTADVVHIHSGANAIWALILRLFGKKVYITQFAMDWKRDKWAWYGKLFYLFSNYLTAYCPNAVVFDNIFTKDFFEKKFKRKYLFIPYGSEVSEPPSDCNVLERLGLVSHEYFLFVGRFIPDKGIHLLIEAFQKLNTNKKLVLVGGSPNPSEYEFQILKNKSEQIIFPGYVYGEDTNFLMKHAYTYVQPSLIEGLSPVILTIMGLGTPLICSDIVENTYITQNNALLFSSGDVTSLHEKLEYSLQHPDDILQQAKAGKINVSSRFNWEKITDQYVELFKK